jgi:sigma-B regulation protein RsbU (phosphoserine phosphatase)
MIQPKDLYRELGALLANIDNGSTKVDFLFSVLKKLEISFTRDLHISKGRLYVEDVDRFFLVNPPDSQEPANQDGVRALDPEAVRYITKNGSYIFDNPSVHINNQIGEQGEYAIAAAFTVRNPGNRWIFVFALQSGWVREEVEFCLNAVRALLNFRLYSDAMENDMQRAALIQQSLLPRNPPSVIGYETAGRSLPAEVVGGDFFDFSVFDDDVFSVAVGDASGHGLPAALLVRDVVTGLRMGVEKEMQMAEAMQKLNRVIHRSTLSAGFISLFYGEIESNGNIFYVNAGHPPPLLVHGSQVEQLNATGMILGAVPDISIQRAFARFDSGDVLVMYSDGLLERLSNDEEEFGLPRLAALIVQHQQKSAKGIVDVIQQTVFDFGSQAKWQDDFTVVVVKKLTS